MNPFFKLDFDFSFINNLPGVELPSTPSRYTPGVSYSLVSPTVVANPKMLVWSRDAAQLLDLGELLGGEPDLAQIFSGNLVPSNLKPYAARYGGHQFGNWAGQLGDGRAISLGSVKNKKSEKWEIQLKGAGPTPYSRGADGRAVLRSSVREFFCSEAMFYLGVPTTRALSCVLTGEKVVRDMFYDGRPQEETGAIVTRLSPSFIRFGHFQIYHAYGEQELLRQFTDFVIGEHFPQYKHQNHFDYLSFFNEVVEKTAALIVEWMRVGFVHGVMNTDNMSIHGLTMDYGPYGWLDVFDRNWTPNTTDAERRRYTFGNQPGIGLWNLARLGEVLCSLTEVKGIEDALEKYQNIFSAKYLDMMARKLGLDSSLGEEFLSLVKELERLFSQTEVDPTLFFRNLVDLNFDSIRDSFYTPKLPEKIESDFLNWFRQYQALVQKNSMSGEIRREIMLKANPYFIPRNYIVQNCIESIELGDLQPMNELMQMIKAPYEATELNRKFFVKRPDWAKDKAGCSALSCSS